METLARLVTQTRSAWGIVVCVLLLVWVCIGQVGKLQHEDDLLAFLPQDNPEIAQFQQINQDFGGLDAALIGVATDDVFDPDFLVRLAEVTRELQDLPELDHVLSLTSVQDFAPDPLGGIRTQMLVPAPPETAEEQALLRSRVMSRDAVAGTLVSEDGTAVVLVAFAAYRSDPRKVSEKIQGIVAPRFLEDQVYWGGAPFVSSYIFETTQADISRLSPYAVLAIVLIMLVVFRDWRGTLLGLSAAGLGILVSRAAMAAADVPLNIVLGSMPIILFSVGSAYSIHILSRYQNHARKHPPDEAVRRTILGTGPTVLTAGLTTAVGMLSFVWMDIEPLRTFGIFTAVGVLATLALSLSLVPAVIFLLGLKGGTPGGSILGPRLAQASVWTRHHRLGVGVGLLCVLVLGVVLAGGVDSRVDQSAFYSEGSPPDLGERFLAEHFGGAQFIQVLVQGDLREPVHLRRIERMVGRLEGLQHVSRVQHLGVPVGLLNAVMEGQRRIPDSRAKVEALFGLLTGSKEIRQLVDEERSQALLHVQVGTRSAAEIERLLMEVEQLVHEETAYRVGPAAQAQVLLRSDVAERIQRVLAGHGVAVAHAASVESLKAVGETPNVSAVQAAVRAHLLGSETLVPVSPEEAAALTTAVVGLGPGAAEVAVNGVVADALGLGATDLKVQDLAWSIGAPLEEAWDTAITTARAGGVLGSLGLAPGHPSTARIATALMDLDVPTAAIPDPSVRPALAWTVSGLPVMHRGLSRSVTANQFKSLGFALGLVALILSIAFKSARAGLLATAPTALSLAVVYGGMGLMGIHLDIGTSMLASLIIGAGVDYAVHLQSSWYAEPGEHLSMAAARSAVRVGPAIWTNALMVSVGFFVLTLGEARPLQNVGGLTAAAMLIAALATFLVIPVLAGRRSYSLECAPEDPADAQLQGLDLLNPAAGGLAD
jgi:uncharacterized protein